METPDTISSNIRSWQCALDEGTKLPGEEVPMKKFNLLLIYHSALSLGGISSFYIKQQEENIILI